MSEILLCVALIILSFAVLIAVAGAFGMKFTASKENQKIEVTKDTFDNSKPQ